MSSLKEDRASKHCSGQCLPKAISSRSEVQSCYSKMWFVQAHSTFCSLQDVVSGHSPVSSSTALRPSCLLQEAVIMGDTSVPRVQAPSPIALTE